MTQPRRQREVSRWEQAALALPLVAILVFVPDPLRFPAAGALLAVGSLYLFWVGRSRFMLFAMGIGIAVALGGVIAPAHRIRGGDDADAVRAARASAGPLPMQGGAAGCLDAAHGFSAIGARGQLAFVGAGRIGPCPPAAAQAKR